MEKFKDILKLSCATVLAGSPSCGKTSLALNIVEQYGLNEGKVVCYFTLEQSAEELVHRLAFLRAGLNTKIAESDELSQEEKKQLEYVAEELQNSKIFIDDSVTLTTQGIAVKIGKIVEKCGSIDLIIIDYSQLISPVSKSITAGIIKNIAEFDLLDIYTQSYLMSYTRREEERTKLIELDALAKILNVPILALFQLGVNRKRLAIEDVAINTINKHKGFNGQWLFFNTDYRVSVISLFLYNGTTINKIIPLEFNRHNCKFYRK